MRFFPFALGWLADFLRYQDTKGIGTVDWITKMLAKGHFGVASLKMGVRQLCE